MNKVFPLKYYCTVNRSMWGPGPWDSEDIDREQWSDPQTGYPCLAIRCEIGCWSGYVGVDRTHPAFGYQIDELPGVCWWGYTDAQHFIEPWPASAAPVDPENPKESILATTRIPDHLWFFGFDFAHAGDLIPGINGVLQATLIRSHKSQEGTYKTLEYTKKRCAEIALILWGCARLNLTETMIKVSENQSFSES